MIVGRKKEISILKKVLNSPQAEFIALYGRRRVGKTYLVRQTLEKEKNYFEIAGIKDASLKKQLGVFSQSFSQKYFDGLKILPPKSWLEAFSLLTLQIQKIPESEKVILFFDELPWLSSKKSGFMQALDYFWNREWCKHPNLLLVVCGSAASWMIDNLINDKGGLHNRITKKILLEPFKLNETKEFLCAKGFKGPLRKIIEIYMVLGGIPYYLMEYDLSLSVAQNINKMCFDKDGILTDEFPKLFKSLFDQSEINRSIVRLIAKNHYGVTREEILKSLSLPSGGRLNKRLEELESTGFIKKLLPFGKKTGHYYRVVDEYSLFYLTWVEGYIEKGGAKDYWLKQIGTPRYYTWMGYAFEVICFKHLDLIETALGIESLVISTGSWKSKKDTKKQGAQVDCFFERSDNAVNLCEIKFKDKIYEVTREEALNLKNKIHRFMEEWPKTEVFLSIISASGIKKNIWSEDLVSSAVSGDDLFKDS